MNGPAFAAYVSEVLIREIAPGTAPHPRQPCHPSQQTSRRHAQGTRLLVSVPAAILTRPEPDRTGVFKAHLRRMGARAFTAVFDAIGEICNLYDPVECWNYFRAAGYASN
nr:hypothetical protein [uncultured Roseovarius sp.]